MAAELEARRQGLPEQENSSRFLLVPKLTSWEEEETRETTHFPPKPWSTQICHYGEAEADASSKPSASGP